MRSFVRAAAVALACALLAPVLYAQSSQPERLYKEALERESTLRLEMDTLRAGASPVSVLERIRVLVGSYEDFSRLFPSSGYSDNALWQGAMLSAAAFWEFGHAEDRVTALGLLEDLAGRFPSSSLIKQIPPEVKRLNAAASDAVHVGDSHRFDVETASRAGMRTVWFMRSDVEAAGNGANLAVSSLVGLAPLIMDHFGTDR